MMRFGEYRELRRRVDKDPRRQRQLEIALAFHQRPRKEWERGLEISRLSLHFKVS